MGVVTPPQGHCEFQERAQQCLCLRKASHMVSVVVQSSRLACQPSLTVCRLACLWPSLQFPLIAENLLALAQPQTCCSPSTSPWC